MTKRDKLIARIVARPTTATFEDVRSVLIEYGWEQASQEGSHVRFRKSGERSISIPLMSGKTVKRRYLDQICIRLGLDPETETH